MIFRADIFFTAIFSFYSRLRLTKAEPIRPTLDKFPPFASLVLARRQPCCVLRKTKDKNFSERRVCKFSKSKFSARQGKGSF